MSISTHLTRIACGTAATGLLLLGGAGVAQAQEETPRPLPPGSLPATAAPQRVAPQVAPGTLPPRGPATTAPSAAPPEPGPQVRAVPEGAPETGGGPADPALDTVAALVGGPLALALAAGAVTVAVRRT